MKQLLSSQYLPVQQKINCHGQIMLWILATEQ